MTFGRRADPRPPEGSDRAPSSARRLLRAASALVGVGLLVLMLVAAVVGDGDDPFGAYLLAAAVVAGLLGFAATWLLHRRFGWRLSPVRAVGLSAVAALMIGPAGAFLLSIPLPASGADPFEWLELGLLGGVAAGFLTYGARPPS